MKYKKSDVEKRLASVKASMAYEGLDIDKKDMDDCKMASGLNTFEALNIIDFYPVPHHTNFPFAKAVEKIIAKYESKINLYPINNSQVILVEKDNIRVVGK